MSIDQEYHGYACFKANEPLKLHTFEPEVLGDNDVEIHISHCGICHTDLHFIDGFGGMTQFPLVAGHEIVGTITKLGKSVSDLQIGQRVGVGAMTDSCMKKNCHCCKSGNEQYCSGLQMTYNSPLPSGNVRFGGFQNKIRCSSNFVFNMPDGIDSASGAPLLCAGATVYTPLARYGAGTLRKKIGIVGMGGLGHLAIQFASKMGAEVTVISTSDSKKNDAIKFGADNFIISKNEDEMKAAANSLDLIINTVSEITDLGGLLSLIKLDGVLVLVALNFEVKIPALALIFKRTIVTSSLIASKQEMQDMLNFAARHNIGAQVQVLNMDKINEGIDMVKKNESRYRIVLQNPNYN